MDLHTYKFHLNAHLPARVPAEHSETAYITGRAIDFIEEAGTEPWCLHLSYIKPHWPYMTPSPYAGMYSADQALPIVRDKVEKENVHPVYSEFQKLKISTAMSRDDVRNSVLPAYMGMIKQIDDEIGRLVKFLDERGQMDHTMIIFTSDHGDYLGDHWLGEKDLFHEPSVRIPFIVCDPNKKADKTRGTSSNELVEAIDVVPTILEAVGGYPQPHILDGRALQPLLHGEKAVDWRKYVISEYDYSFMNARIDLDMPSRECWLRMVFDGRFKYIKSDGFRPMLFDLVSDPNEFNDLGDSPAFAKERTRLDRMLFEWALKPRQRVTITDGMLENTDIQRNITEAGILIGYYNKEELAKVREKWKPKPIFAAFNPVWNKMQNKLKKGN